MSITTLILDAGGVLVYPVRGEWTVPHALPEHIGGRMAEIPGPRWAAACKEHAPLLREDVILDGAGELRQRLLFLRAVNRAMEWNLSEEALLSLAEDFTHNPVRYGWYDDVEPMLALWQGKYRLGMLTDAMPSFPMFVRQRGVDKYFETIVASTQIGVCKPDARMYLEICRRMGVSPEECLFVDDRVNNLQGAQAVGMTAVQMCRDGLEPWGGAFVRDLAGLNPYLEELL